MGGASDTLPNLASGQVPLLSTASYTTAEMGRDSAQLSLEIKDKELQGDELEKMDSEEWV